MKEIVQKYISAFNDFDIETMVSLMHSDCIYEGRTNGTLTYSIKGKHGFRQVCTMSKNNYKYRKQVIEGFTRIEDKLEVKIYFKATLAVDIDDLGKKGEQIAFETKSIFEFKNGLIYKLTNID